MGVVKKHWGFRVQIDQKGTTVTNKWKGRTGVFIMA